ncbi:MAG: C-GCAxxG-C-C family (seleno)protein [Bacillota bacterium]
MSIHSNEEGVQKELSRRKFLLSAGATAAGIVVTGAVAGLGVSNQADAAEPVKIEINGIEIKSRVPARIENSTTLAPVRPVAETLGAKVVWDGPARTVRITKAADPVAAPTTLTAPAWPWPYKKLDPEVVRKRGYEEYFKGGCMYGAAAALLMTLREEVGAPYDLIPLDIYKYGAGGVSSWGTLCGALNGSCAVINMVTKDYGALTNELLGWYTEVPFPTNKYDAYCKFPKQVTTVSKSPLCHASVSLWCDAAGAKVNGDEKKDRCAKVTGDTAAKSVEILNAQMAGSFVAVFKASEEFSHCMSCHTGANSMLDNEQGKMNCISCHDLPNPVGPHK